MLTSVDFSKKTGKVKIIQTACVILQHNGIPVHSHIVNHLMIQQEQKNCQINIFYIVLAQGRIFSIIYLYN